MTYLPGDTLRRSFAYTTMSLLFAASTCLAVMAFPPVTTAQTQQTTGTAEREALFNALESASSEHEARQIEDQIWRHWMAAAPDAETGRLLRDAMNRRESYDLEGARLILNDAIERAPDYSEVWNQRAFVLYLQGKLDRSLEDIDRTLELEPRHFGALAGKARILMEQGRALLGQKALRQAIEIHPFLRERSLLLPEPKGIDL